jgi:hypothetical protein
VPPQYSFDVYAAHERIRTMTEQVNHIRPSDLQPLTRNVYERIGEILAGVNDVTFVPPSEDGEENWNLAHVIMHVTASIEERACIGSLLARGCEITGSVRSETDWEMIHSANDVLARLQESHRMALGYLQTWPDHPDMTLEYEHGWLGPMNAIASHLSGLNHAIGHLEQIGELVRITP